MRTGGQEDRTTGGQEDKRTGGQDRWDNSLADSYSYWCTCATHCCYSVTPHIFCWLYANCSLTELHWVPSSQLVHSCSWRHWTQSSLPYSTEAVGIWRSWRWGGHGGPNSYYDRFWYKYSYPIKKNCVICAQLVVPGGPWVTLANKIMIYLLDREK